MKAKNKKLKYITSKAAIPFWLALLTFILTILLSRHPQVTETAYSQTIFPAVSFMLSLVGRWSSFSMSDIFYALLIALLLILLALVLARKIKISRFLILVLQTVALCYSMFYWLWGFNYYRPGINERLSVAQAKPDTIQFVQILEKLITQTNNSRCSFDNITKAEIENSVDSSYRQCASFLGISRPSIKSIKPITLSPLFAKASIAGYYGPFFGEIHLNDKLLMIEYPQVLAHEAAHQMGITGEAEANFYSWLVCTRSSSAQLRYSANLNILGYFLAQARHLHNFANLLGKIQKPVRDDIKTIQKHWENLRDEKIDSAAGKVNDAYLKINKIDKGIDDYFGVVQLVMDFEADTSAQKRLEENN